MSKSKEAIEINEMPLLIVSSEKLEGMLTLEKAKKYKIGLFETINFKTYCALNDKLSNYYSNYVILVKTGNWLFPYKEPFTNQSIVETDSRIVRGLSNYIDLIYTGNETNLQELTQSKLGQLFPNKKTLEEYKLLLTSFAEENKKAFQEIKEIIEEENQKLNMISEITSYNTPNKPKGKEIFEDLSIHNEKSNEIYANLCRLSDDNTKPQVLRYTIKNK